MIRILASMVLAGAIAVATAACGGESEPADSSAAAEATESSSPTATPTEAPPRISAATMCDLLFSSKENPLGHLTDAWGDERLSPRQFEQLQDDVELLDDIAGRAPEEYELHMQAIADIARDFVTAAEEGTETTYSGTDLKAAGYEIINACE